MKLTFEQIRKITFGALAMTQEADGIHFIRFTPEQLDVWGAYSPTYRSNALEPSGVRLDFYTDSETILFDMIFPGVYEVLVDGLHHTLLQVQKKSRHTVTTGAGEKRVTLLFPCDNPGTLDAVFIDEGASVRPYEYRRKFLFLGDSITQGCTASRPSCNFLYRMAGHYDADILSWAVGGTGFLADTLVDSGFDPDAIFIAYGTNDYTGRKSAEELHGRCKAYLDRVKELWPDKQVFCVSPLWRADGGLRRVTGTIDSCRQIIISEIESHGFVHIDGYSICPHHPDYFADKRLHPNDLGFSCFVQGVLKATEGKL